MYRWVFSERLKMSGDEHRRIASGRVFQARGPATAKAQSPSVERRLAGTVKSAEEAERRRRRGNIQCTLHKHIHFSKLGNLILDHIEHFTGFVHTFKHCFPGL